MVQLEQTMIIMMMLLKQHEESIIQLVLLSQSWRHRGNLKNRSVATAISDWN